MSGQEGWSGVDSEWLPKPLRECEIAQTWESRTARFVVLRSGGDDPELSVVKRGLTWTASDAERLYTAHLRWGAALNRGVDASTRGLRALTWYADPPSVVLELVDGMDLDEWLAESHQREEIEHVIQRCGSALGLLHMPSPDIAVCPLSEDWFLAVPTAGDFAPYNVRLRAEGELVVLDPHAHPEKVTALRDIAWFLFWARRALSGVNDADVRGAFLHGYKASTDVDLTTSGHRAALSALLGRCSIVRARTYVRQRRWRIAGRMARWALVHYADAWRCGVLRILGRLSP